MGALLDFFSLPSLPSVFSLRKEAVAPLRALGVQSWEFSCLSGLAAVSLRPGRTGLHSAFFVSEQAINYITMCAVPLVTTQNLS